MTGLYPVSLVTDGGALNITIISRHDYVDFGLIACSKSVPRIQRLLDYLEDGLVELEQAVVARQPSKPAVKRKASSKAKADTKPNAKPKARKATSSGKASKSPETPVK